MKKLPFVIHEVVQRTPEWFQLRAGRLTGSVAADMFKTVLKSGGEPAARRDLRMKLATERITQLSQEGDFVSADMQWGMDREAEAITRYEGLTGNMANRTGFISHPTLLVGSSLDAHSADYGIVISIKCPKSATHLGYLKESGVPADYYPQMLHEMWLTDADEYHFMSFDPRFPKALQCHLVVVRRDQDAIDGYSDKALTFLREVDRDVAEILTLDGIQSAVTPGRLAKGEH